MKKKNRRLNRIPKQLSFVVGATYPVCTVECMEDLLKYGYAHSYFIREGLFMKEGIDLNKSKFNDRILSLDELFKRLS